MLTQDDIELLTFEENNPQHTGIKAERIRTTLGLTSARYYPRLRRLTRDQDAIARFPLLCARVQRLTERGRAERAELTRLAS
jgi:hypothetical protein